MANANTLHPISLELGTPKQRALLQLVYFNPMINSHEIAQRLPASNVHDLSRKLNIKLKQMGYILRKYSIEGQRKPYRWVLENLPQQIEKGLNEEIIYCESITKSSANTLEDLSIFIRSKSDYMSFNQIV